MRRAGKLACGRKVYLVVGFLVLRLCCRDHSPVIHINVHSNNREGFLPLAAIIGIAVVVIIGGASFILANRQSDSAIEQPSVIRQQETSAPRLVSPQPNEARPAAPLSSQPSPLPASDVAASKEDPGPSTEEIREQELAQQRAEEIARRHAEMDAELEAANAEGRRSPAERCRMDPETCE